MNVSIPTHPICKSDKKTPPSISRRPITCQTWQDLNTFWTDPGDKRIAGTGDGPMVLHYFVLAKKKSNFGVGFQTLALICQVLSHERILGGARPELYPRACSDSGTNKQNHCVFCWEESPFWQPTADHLITESWVVANPIHGHISHI